MSLKKCLIIFLPIKDFFKAWNININFIASVVIKLGIVIYTALQWGTVNIASFILPRVCRIVWKGPTCSSGVLQHLGGSLGNELSMQRTQLDTLGATVVGMDSRRPRGLAQS